LKPGDVLITSGLQQMRAGQAVVSLTDKGKGDKKDKQSGGKKSDKPEVTSAPGKATQMAHA
jgi:hypothetical protein